MHNKLLLCDLWQPLCYVLDGSLFVYALIGIKLALIGAMGLKNVVIVLYRARRP